MYPRFGMTEVAIQTAQARMRAAQLQQQHHHEMPRARAAVATDDSAKQALWRMGAVIALIVAVAGAIAWFTA